VTSSLKLLGLGLALLILHALATAILPAGARPDLILIFALALGLRARGTGALVLSFLLGFCVDVLSGSPLGLYALLRGTACAGTRLLDRALYLRAPLPWAVYVLGYSILDVLLLSFTLRLLVPEGAIAWWTILLRIPLSALITAVLSVPLLSLIQRLHVDARGEIGWASFTSRART
jgi:rod shape-determining protein MreD